MQYRRYTLVFFKKKRSKFSKGTIPFSIITSYNVEKDKSSPVAHLLGLLSCCSHGTAPGSTAAWSWRFNRARLPGCAGSALLRHSSQTH